MKNEKIWPSILLIVGMLMILTISCKTNYDELIYDKSSNMLFKPNGKPFSGTAVLNRTEDTWVMDYKNGKIDGSFICYDHNNIKVSESTYYEGKRIGETKWYDPKGNKVSYEEYKEKNYSRR